MGLSLRLSVHMSFIDTIKRFRDTGYLPFFFLGYEINYPFYFHGYAIMGYCVKYLSYCQGYWII